MDEWSETEQWEWLKTQIREYGLWVLGGILLGGAGIYGWFAWQSHQDEVGRQASEKYEQVRDAFAKGDRSDGLIALGELERDYASTPYVDQGRLAAARSDVEAGELDQAAQELGKVATGSKDPDLARIARLRLARVQIAQGKPDAALATLEDMNPGAFEPRYHEVRGDAFYAKGDKATALTEYRKAIASDLEGTGDHTLLQLKIADLAAPAAPAAPTAKTDAPQPAGR